ncbi:MAG TPA: serine/threonine-protein kinase, partial [Planctomycetota bacterium]|nr:serine/threonine-protein kinase [Planctomycetota bacterium]
MTVSTHPLERDSLLKNLPRNPAGDPILGGMHLQSRLGKGAMGAVYKGHHPRLNVAVAVKVLPPNLADPKATEQAARWFQREAQLLWQVQSTNVVRVSDVGQDTATGLHYMVMDYVHGMPLGRFLDAYESFMVQPETPSGAGAAGATPARRGVSESIAVAICLAAARGLEAIHAKNIVHRDIKPDNILIPYRNGFQRLNDITELDFDKTQLVDLGIARQEKDDNSTQQGLILGTPAYMAPEQARGLDVTKPSDVYALGATLYFLLAGQAPFVGQNPAEIVVQVAHEAPQPIEKHCSNLSPATRQLLARCMQKDPAQRFEDGRALRRACDQLAATVPPDAQTRRLFRLPENSAIAPAIQLPSPSAPTPASTAPQRPKTVAQAPTHPGGGAANAPTTVRRGTTAKQLPVAGAKPSTGKTRSKQAPVAPPPPPAAATSTAVIEEPVHAPDLTPAFGQSELALESEL